MVLYTLGLAVLYRGPHGCGDAWRNLCKLKTLYENGWVPQKCGTYEIIEKRYHKYHNVVISVALCVVISNRGRGVFLIF